LIWGGGLNKLTEKQKQFIDYYIKTGNKTESARLAGYKQPESQGHQNYEKLRIYIEQRLKKKDEERIADGDEVLRYFTSIMRGEATEEVAILIGEGRQQLVEKSAAIKDRTEAAKQLAKRYGIDQPDKEATAATDSAQALVDAVSTVYKKTDQ
jgi:phage terminase small subunit